MTVQSSIQLADIVFAKKLDLLFHSPPPNIFKDKRKIPSDCSNVLADPPHCISPWLYWVDWPMMWQAKLANTLRKMEKGKKRNIFLVTS